MKYVIVYFSRFGNGKKLVEYLAGKLKEKTGAVQLFKPDEADPGALPEADVYVFSAAAEAFSLQRDMKRFMNELKGLEGRTYGIINTHGMKKDRLDKMEKILSKKNMVKLAGVEFHVEGDGVQTGNGLPSGWQARLDEFAGKLGQM
jgi:flavodoxin